MNFKEGERAWGRARATLQIGIHFISITVQDHLHFVDLS